MEKITSIKLDFFKKVILLIIISLLFYSYFILLSSAHYSLDICGLSTQYRDYQYRPPVLFQMIEKSIIKISVFFISIFCVLRIYDLCHNTYSYYRESGLVFYITIKKYMYLLPKFNKSEYKISLLL